MATYSISLGGSIVIKDEINTTYLKKFITLLNNLHKDKHKVGLIIGGGKTVRKYQQAATKVTKCTNDQLDLIGIKQVHMHAQWLHILLQNAFKGKLYPKVVPEDTKINLKTYDLVIFTAKRTGRTTDYGASVFAKNHNAQVINLSNIYYVYDKDPKIKGAKPQSELTWMQYQKLFSTHKAGMHAPFDPVAAKYCKQHKLSVKITNGEDLANLKKVLADKGQFTVIR